MFFDLLSADVEKVDGPRVAIVTGSTSSQDQTLRR
jgi:hypothetical protein